MFDKAGVVLYVGKAKNLKKRVSSYFQRALDTKTHQLIKQLHNIEVTVTRNEREALLLENNLIKAELPRYNVIFRDDKSYPYLKITVNEAFPQLSFYRGRSGEGELYGPYPSVREARSALNLLQTIFKLRQCELSFFKNRTRPCLQYQIKRCSAPCVGYISEDDYHKDVQLAQLFLEGKSTVVIETLVQKMQHASQNQLFEKAARIRDQIALLNNIQAHQIIIGDTEEADVLGIYREADRVCIHVLSIREGRMLGSRQYFPNQDALLLSEENPLESLLEAFILQHYQGDVPSIPKLIILPILLANKETLTQYLSDLNKRAVSLITATKGDRLRWVTMATTSARLAVLNKIQQQQDLTPRFLALQESLQLPALPECLVCFDASHTLGEATVVSAVVLGLKGPLKAEYRRFNIRALTAGDDYAALKEGLTRYFTRLKSEGETLPDVIIVDGGKGQLNVAKAVLEECQVEGMALLGIAKGPHRKAGLETLYRSVNDHIVELKVSDFALHLMQQIRDEAHRFAIRAHRERLKARRRTSALEQVPGVGPKRRQQILEYFGGLNEVLAASVDALARVPGVNRKLAERLYETLHGL